MADNWQAPVSVLMIWSPLEVEGRLTRQFARQDGFQPSAAITSHFVLFCLILAHLSHFSQSHLAVIKMFPVVVAVRQCHISQPVSRAEIFSQLEIFSWRCAVAATHLDCDRLNSLQTNQISPLRLTGADLTQSGQEFFIPVLLTIIVHISAPEPITGVIMSRPTLCIFLSLCLTVLPIQLLRPLVPSLQVLDIPSLGRHTNNTAHLQVQKTLINQLQLLRPGTLRWWSSYTW